MISQKESSINNKTVGFDEYDPQIYAKVQEIQRQYRVARENEWYARKEHMASQMADDSVSFNPASLNELIIRVRYLTKEVCHLQEIVDANKEIVDAKGLLLDASIEEIYGEKI